MRLLLKRLPTTNTKNVQSNDALVPLSTSTTTEREWTITTVMLECKKKQEKASYYRGRGLDEKQFGFIYHLEKFLDTCVLTHTYIYTCMSLVVLSII